MTLEVLVACMNQSDFALAAQLNLACPALFINQATVDGYREISYNGHKLRMITTPQRGLSRSRNMALSHADGDICLFCDDDVVYRPDMAETVLTAFRLHPAADIIIFDIERIGSSRRHNPVVSDAPAPRWRFFSSVQLAFRRQSLQRNNLWLDSRFGAGSSYGSGEETILLRQAQRKHLVIRTWPAVIATVDFSASSWFQGFDARYFYDKGALLAAAFRPWHPLLLFYYIVASYRRTDLSAFAMLRWLRRGMQGLRHGTTYDDRFPTEQIEEEQP